MTHHVALRQELTNYRGQNVEAYVCGFSLPDFWLRKSKPTLAQGTGELVAPPDLPHLALVARLYFNVFGDKTVSLFFGGKCNWR